MNGRRDRAFSRGRDRAGRGAIGGAQNKMHNEAYRAAYAQCMTSRSYGS